MKYLSILRNILTASSRPTEVENSDVPPVTPTLKFYFCDNVSISEKEW